MPGPISLHKHVVLLVNLGTPSHATPRAVGRYLREFLSDPRVVEIPALFWKPLLYGLIVPLRAGQSAKNYASIWTDQGSPLAVYHHQLAQALQQKFDQTSQKVSVLPAMRYAERGEQSPHLHLQDALIQCEKAGVKQLVVLPMFPQNCGATTGSIFDMVQNFWIKKRAIPSIHFCSDFADSPFWIDSLKQRLETYWQGPAGRPDFAHGDCLVMSFHGMPKRTQRLGDPYFDACVRTTEALAKALDLHRGQYQMTFQSRFGPEKWLSPSTNDMLKLLGKKGHRVDVICPSFVADCVETLEEIAQEGKEHFHHSGGKQFHYIACVNTEPFWIEQLFTHVNRFIINTD